MPEIVPVAYGGSYWKHWKTESKPKPLLFENTDQNQTEFVHMETLTLTLLNNMTKFLNVKQILLNI